MLKHQRARRLGAYLLSFSIILACLGAGKFIATLLPFPFPGSILGMLILFLLLNFQLIRFTWIDASANLLLRHMALLFIPVAVGLLNYLDTVMASLSVILLNVIVGICLILLVVGRLYQRMNR